MCKVSHFVVAHFGYIQADYSESSCLECSPKQSNAEKLAYSFENAILTIWNALRGRGRVGTSRRSLLGVECVRARDLSLPLFVPFPFLYCD